MVGEITKRFILFFLFCVAAKKLIQRLKDLFFVQVFFILFI